VSAFVSASVPAVGIGSGLYYAMLAAATWGVVLFVKERYFAGYDTTTFTAVVFAFAAAWHLPVTVLALRGRPAVPADVGVASWALVGGTVVCLAAGLLALFYALSVGEVSYVAPFTGVVAAFVLPIELVVLGAAIAPLEALGIAAATVAVYLANYRGGGVLAPARRAVGYRPAQLALASAAILGVQNVGQRVVLQEIGLDPSAWVVLKIGGAAVVLAPVAVRGETAVRGDLRRFGAAGLLLAAAEFCIARAFALLPASIATPIVSLQAVVAVLLGGLVLGEGGFRLRLAAAAVAVAGVWLIAAG